MRLEGAKSQYVILHGAELVIARKAKGWSQAGCADRLKAAGVKYFYWRDMDGSRHRRTIQQRYISLLELRHYIKMELSDFAVIGQVLGILPPEV